MDEFHHLFQAQREAIKAIRDAEKEIIELLEQRVREEQCVVLMTPYSDVAQIKKEELPQEEIAKVTNHFYMKFCENYA
jgi:DNA replication initiation complex subunit (GINS family)